MKKLGILAAAAALAACSAAPEGGDGERSSQEIGTAGDMDLNLAAGSLVLYEAQIRAANACDPNVGSAAQREACARKPAPKVAYRAEGRTCGAIDALSRIKLGTIDDMLEDTADAKLGITTRYVREKVGANAIWLMPVFPNNDTWALPDGCDNLGSPYAVRDYMHASGMLSRRCIAQERDERSDAPCWANDDVDRLVADAHARGLKVLFDVAFNHFGHNYELYDYAGFRSVRARTRAGENLDRLWDFGSTFDAAYVHPSLVDTPEALEREATRDADVRADLDALRAKCPSLSGQALVKTFGAWREAFEGERAQMACDAPYLELAAPGFYLGANRWDPASRMGDNFSNNWVDVKFLFHREENPAHRWEFVRTREYLFRVMNYWSSRGVDGFRLDHATDGDSGFGSNEWKYILSKVDRYAAERGQPRPIYLAEEFADQQEMNKVVDVMTEGYVGDMCGRNGANKDASFVQRVLGNMDRFRGRTFVMTGLETHDEPRLTDGTGFDIWTGAGFWGIGASTRSTPMIYMGQELGERRGRGFSQSNYVHARFEGSDTYEPQGEALTGYYHKLATERLRFENRALLAPGHAFLRSRWTNAPDPRIFAQVKWSDDRNVIFVFHNLWTQAVEQSYFVDPELAATIGLRDDRRYRLYDVVADRQAGACRSGADIKMDLYVSMDAATRAQWLRLESCP